MSGYPDKGKVQILVKAYRSTTPDHVLKVEEIILSHPDPRDEIAETIRTLEGREYLDMTIYEGYSPGEEPCYGLEARIYYDVETDSSARNEQSRLTKDILAKLGQFLAESPGWLFNPVGELDMLGLRADEIAGVCVLTKSSSSSDGADGKAFLRTDKGDISVFQEAGYLRLAWLTTRETLQG